jgi:hypothetical protein
MTKNAKAFPYCRSGQPKQDQVLVDFEEKFKALENPEATWDSKWLLLVPSKDLGTGAKKLIIDEDTKLYEILNIDNR